MKRLPTLLLIAGMAMASLVLYLLWQAHTQAAQPSTVALNLRVLDAEGYPLAGAEIMQLHELRRAVVGVSDAFGSWQGQLVEQGKLLELHINKQSASALLQASRTYPTGQEQLQDIVHLQAEPHLPTRSSQAGYVRLEVAEPYLRQALLDWCQQAGIHVAANGKQVLTVRGNTDNHLQVSLATPSRDLFSFAITYRKLRSHTTVQKILRGIYAHTKHAYTAWYEEENKRWYVYNPAGFWRLRADAVLVNAQGKKFYPRRTAPQFALGRALTQQLALKGGESVCSQRECVVYSSHARQNVY